MRSDKCKEHDLAVQVDQLDEDRVVVKILSVVQRYCSATKRDRFLSNTVHEYFLQLATGRCTQEGALHNVSHVSAVSVRSAGINHVVEQRQCDVPTSDIMPPVLDDLDIEMDS